MKAGISILGMALAILPVATATATAVPTSPSADTRFLLRATVPVHCEVQQRGGGGTAASMDGAVSLGQFREYCNAPGGYALVVRYAPGSMRGAVLAADGDRIVLNGSGEAVLSRASGPRVRERTITATPGENGFDTDRLSFELVPAGMNR